VLSSTEMLSEPLATFAFLGFVRLCLEFAARPTWRGAVGAGLCLGGSLLCRPAFVFMLPLTVLWSAWQFRDRRHALVLALGIPALAVATLAPWTVRNYRVFHAFIPFSTMGGSVLLQGNNRIVATIPQLRGYSVWDTDLAEYEPALRSANDELARDRLAKRFGVAWLKANPDRWASLARAKFLRSWTPFLQPHSPRLYRLVTLFSWGPVLVLFCLAAGPTLVASLRTGHPGWLIHLGISTYVFTSIIFFGSMRYRIPIEPLCIVLAARTVDYALVALREVRGRVPARAALAHRGAVGEPI
jgi:4-amino-4-deoxy-L-arabinose transferase-like glycosyltransferase